MKHKKHSALLALLLAAQASAGDDITGMFTEGKLGGQLREFSVSRTIDDSRPAADNDYTRSANAVGGYLKYETAEWNGLGLGAALYTTNGFGLKEEKATNREVDPTLLGKDNDSYAFLGEAYLRYKQGNTTFKAGRQRLDTPLAGSDDARMLPNLFEAYLVSNSDVKGLTLIAAHVTKFAQGTFGRAYNAGLLSVTSGYSLVDSRDQTGKFVEMGEYAVGEKTGGVSVAAAVYSGMSGMKIEVWDYYAHNILNAVYADARYDYTAAEGFAPYAAAQYIGEKDVGNNGVIDKVDSRFTAAKAGIKVAGLDLYGAVSYNSKGAKAAVNGGTLSPWGGMPAFTQGMVTRHQFMAGTDAWKVAGSYDWKETGTNLKTVFYHAAFAMDKKNGYSADHAWTARESGMDIIYTPEGIKALQLRFRANRPVGFYENAAGSVSWEEFRFIVNYNL